jgi:hypothetical protein
MGGDRLALDRKARLKSACYSGVIAEVAGASLAHHLMATRIRGATRQQLKRTMCEFYRSDIRVFVWRTRPFTDPAAVAVPGAGE